MTGSVMEHWLGAFNKDNMRRLLAIVVGKLIIFLSRALRKGGGSAYSGLVALTIAPNLISEISKKLPQGTLVITGTNGKTTTTKYLSEMLVSSGLRVVANRSGSNLARGIAAALIEQSSVSGHPRGDIGLFEVDEATMPEVMPALNPKLVLITNLFRDQLDRYGELDKTASIIANSFTHLNHAKVILNADDPRVFALHKVIPHGSGAIYFGIDESNFIISSEASFDSKDCVLCNRELVFKKRYFAHMGDYECPTCGFSRPKPEYFASEISLKGVTEASANFSSNQSTTMINLNLPGIHNIYNALGAYSVAKSLNISDEIIKQSLEKSTAAFGRMERLRFEAREVYLLLAKNPSSLTQVVETLAIDKQAKNFLICLNDNLADGTDISWIWDADIEKLSGVTKSIVCSGIRADDMALRIKYANPRTQKIEILSEIVPAFKKAIQKLDEDETLYVLVTYTAMLELRNYLTKVGVVSGFWEANL